MRFAVKQRFVVVFYALLFYNGVKVFIFIKSLNFIYSEKATTFFKISTVDLTVPTWSKSMEEILQNFAAFSEYMNFKTNR